MWTDSPSLSRRRNRPPARARREGRRRNRASGRLSWPSSVICSAELTTRRENWQLETARPSAVLGEPAPLCAKWHLSPWSDANQCRRHNWASLLSQRDLCYFPAGITSRADERSVGEEIERSATSTAAPLRCSPANVAEHAERNRRPRIEKKKFRHCYSPGGVDSAPGEDPSRTKNPHERHIGIVA